MGSTFSISKFRLGLEVFGLEEDTKEGKAKWGHSIKVRDTSCRGNGLSLFNIPFFYSSVAPITVS